jgi:hypothetical protein
MATPQGGSGLRARLDQFWEQGRARRWAVLASAVWVVLVTAYAIGFLGVSRERGTVFLDLMFFLVALVLPLILIWLAAQLAAEMERQRALIAALAEVAVPLTEALGLTRASLERNAPASPEAIEAAVRAALSEARLAEIAGPLGRVAEGQAALQAALRALDAKIATGPVARGRSLPPRPAPRPAPRRGSRHGPSRSATGAASAGPRRGPSRRRRTRPNRPCRLPSPTPCRAPAGPT